MPLNRYADVNGHQEVVTPSGGTPNSTLRSNQGYKMVARALYNFQPQNHRELGFVECSYINMWHPEIGIALTGLVNFAFTI